MATYSCLLSVSNAASGGGVENPPNNNPTSQRAQHKALRTAVHHTASGTHGTCLHVCLCPRQAMHVYAVGRECTQE